MRQIIYFIFLIVIVGSCKKEQDLQTGTTIFEAGLQEHGWVKAQKNGLEFNASAFGVRTSENHFSLLIATYLDSTAIIHRENIEFDEIEFIEKEYIVSGKPNDTGDGFVGAGFYGLISDGHVLNSIYDLDESYENTLTITELDTIRNIIRGTFDVSFKLESVSESIPSPNPNTIFLTKGEFETAIVF